MARYLLDPAIIIIARETHKKKTSLFDPFESVTAYNKTLRLWFSSLYNKSATNTNCLHSNVSLPHATRSEYENGVHFPCFAVCKSLEATLSVLDSQRCFYAVCFHLYVQNKCIWWAEI